MCRYVGYCEFDGTTGDRILIGRQRSEAEIRWQMSKALRSMFSVVQTVATFFTASVSLVLPCSVKKKKVSRSPCSMFWDCCGTLDNVEDAWCDQERTGILGVRGETGPPSGARRSKPGLEGRNPTAFSDLPGGKWFSLAREKLVFLPGRKWLDWGPGGLGSDIPAEEFLPVHEALTCSRLFLPLAWRYLLCSLLTNI